ncbi:phosphoadenosine phosphosulfate reductase [Motilibacter rhizosphaerae]|uniref:Adenosine 5'-phosphosulfate reductase n=1 Tax=Motilibacter rhizosphaerae TaxID=598652 RepID=A0A4Q7NRS2_9ACTN|nr:phosphoadenylyl-sulfate reductase [Motilibacter rhizosphaerae]RZS89468.1 phosphoadenosine phosphosulfate reductase [Motilibacter rhizosphaerae]
MTITTGGSARTAEELQALAARAAHELEDAPAEEVLRWAAATFGERFAVTGSMGADTVLSHLAGRVVPGITVLFIDTGYHFAETIGTRDAVDAVYDVNVRTVLPILSVTQQDEAYGPRLYERDPDRCCAMRKVDPLNAVLGDYDAWGSGVRRDEGPSRAGTPVVAFDAKRGKIKVSPLARWTQDDVDRYAQEHGTLVNPLVWDDYPSIGCEPCTRRVAPGEDARAGRWAGLAKTECGIHL